MGNVRSYRTWKNSCVRAQNRKWAITVILIVRGAVGNIAWLGAQLLLIVLAMHALGTVLAHIVLKECIEEGGWQAAEAFFSRFPNYPQAIRWAESFLTAYGFTSPETVKWNAFSLLLREAWSLPSVMCITGSFFAFTFLVSELGKVRPKVFRSDDTAMLTSRLANLVPDIKHTFPAASRITFGSATRVLGRTIYLSLSDAALFLAGKRDLLYFRIAHELFHARIGDGHLSGLLRHSTTIAAWLTALSLGMAIQIFFHDTLTGVLALILVTSGLGIPLSAAVKATFQKNKELHADLYGASVAPAAARLLFGGAAFTPSTLHPDPQTRLAFLSGGRTHYAGRAFMLVIFEATLILIYRQYSVEQHFGEAYPLEHVLSVVSVYCFAGLCMVYLLCSVRPALTRLQGGVVTFALLSLAVLTWTDYLPDWEWTYGDRPYWYYRYNLANWFFCAVLFGTMVTIWANTLRRR
jgi:hypothetical protein